MNKLLAALACSLLVTFGASAKGPVPADQPGGQADEKQLVEHGHYTNKSGQSVHSPAHSKDEMKPKGATARCRDGTWSFSQSHRGTCSHHGGVSEWVD
jgi:hypothetical protein